LETRIVPSFVQDPNVPAGLTPLGITAGNLFNDGNQSLAVVNYMPGTVTVLQNTTIGPAPITFTQTQTISVGFHPSAAATDVFTGSGLNDLVVANWGDGGGNTVSVLLNNPNSPGTYLPPVTYTVGGGPLIVTTGVFRTGSGLADIVATNSSDNTVSLLPGNGDGTFQSAVTLDPMGTGAAGVATGDFNGDGNLDLVVSNTTSNTVAVFLGNGDGTFQGPILLSTDANPATVAVADLGNGAADLVVACNNNGQPGGFVDVFLGNGDGTFQTPMSFPAGVNPFDVVLGKFSGSGYYDAVVSNFNPSNPNFLINYVTLLRGTGVGTFGAPVQVQQTSAPVGLAVADFNSDGLPDLAVTNINPLAGNSVSLFRNDGVWDPPAGMLGTGRPGGQLPVRAAVGGTFDAAGSRGAVPSLTLPDGRVGLADEVNPSLLHRTLALRLEDVGLLWDLGLAGDRLGDGIEWL
jgi:hypothetical protein